MKTKPFITFRALPPAVVRTAAFGMLCVLFCVPALAQQSGQRRFASAGDASRALFTAIQQRDAPALRSLFGVDPMRLASSDRRQDEQDRSRFIQKYQQMHRLVKEPDGRTVLYVGAENWPFPIPLVAAKGGWYFDTRTGMEEMTCRCIGENEARAIQTCRAFARAHRLLSGKGQSSQHGYYFRAVGGSGSGSAAKKAGGVALVAYPAEYEVTGVKTFLVSPQGAVYEKDLGPKGAQRVRAMTRCRVDSTWLAVK